MKNENDRLQSIDVSELDGVNGGSLWGVTKAVGKKVAAPLTALSAGYSAGKGYSKSRAAGNGVMKSIGNGALEAVKDVSMYNDWSPYAKRALGK